MITKPNAYWNPFADIKRYEQVYAEAKSYIGKRVEVTREDGVRVTGWLRSLSTCADGGLGLTIATHYCDRWISPEFVKIEIVQP
jgi:hypothetical protein